MIDQKYRLNREPKINRFLQSIFEVAVFASVFSFWVLALADTFLGWAR